VERRSFHDPADLAEEVRVRAERVRGAGERIDALTIVPDGEPTLDARLGALIRSLRPLGIPVAVISNGSLVSRPDVRADLGEADWVSLKVDTTHGPTWRRIDRPDRRLDLETILDGMRRFAAEFAGTLVTETMLVRGVNDDPAALEDLADFLEELRPAVACLGVPTRPPAVRSVRAPDAATLARARQALAGRVARVELVTGDEGDAFSASGDVAEDLLAITSVHPMRERAVRALLRRAGADWSVVRALIEDGALVETRHAGQRFLVRGRRGGPRRGPRRCREP
jgi:wyosine [tRNA(Phe)-imidazoG37] synthetase (radical SAM superfamily)